LSGIERQKGIDNIDLQIFLVDDGSTDGTGSAVRRNFPNVRILKGDGELYWNGGMRLAFGEALQRGYDYYLWLNDDVSLYTDAIANLINTSNLLENRIRNPSILTGSMKDPDCEKVTYGGNRKKAWYAPLSYERVEPKDRPVPCDAINGNCVLIPDVVAQKVGNLSPEFTHGAGDYDYSLRAKKQGFESYVAPGYYGTCSQNSISGSCRDKTLPLNHREKILERPTAWPPAKEWMLFARRHAGIFWPVYWIKTYMRVFFPRFWIVLRSQNPIK
jgi:GT2 family glycosyltransferase